MKRKHFNELKKGKKEFSVRFSFVGRNAQKKKMELKGLVEKYIS